jgi:hypothetical protein
MNDYSAPTAYGFRDALVKGFVDEVAIICGASEIARHPRVYERFTSPRPSFRDPKPVPLRIARQHRGNERTPRNE